MSNIFKCNGVEYKLIFDGFYKWSREGSVADGLKGSFTSPQEAHRALKVYENTCKPEVSQVTGEEDLESLTSKADLLKYAEKRNAEVPAKYKQPSAIKKWLMGGYED